LEEPLVELCLGEPVYELAEPHFRRWIEAAEGGKVRIVPQPLDELGEAVYLKEHLDEEGLEVG